MKFALYQSDWCICYLMNRSFLCSLNLFADCVEKRSNKKKLNKSTLIKYLKKNHYYVFFLILYTASPQLATVRTYEQKNIHIFSINFNID